MNSLVLSNSVDMTFSAGESPFATPRCYHVLLPFAIRWLKRASAQVRLLAYLVLPHCWGAGGSG